MVSLVPATREQFPSLQPPRDAAYLSNTAVDPALRRCASLEAAAAAVSTTVVPMRREQGFAATACQVDGQRIRAASHDRTGACHPATARENTACALRKAPRVMIPRQGVARALLAASEQACRAAGRTMLTLHALLADEAAQRVRQMRPLSCVDEQQCLIGFRL